MNTISDAIPEQVWWMKLYTESMYKQSYTYQRTLAIQRIRNESYLFSAMCLLLSTLSYMYEPIMLKRELLGLVLHKRDACAP